MHLIPANEHAALILVFLQMSTQLCSNIKRDRTRDWRF